MTTIGQTVNLMSNDVNRFDQLFVYLHYLWVGPLNALISALILYYTIELSSFVGITILVLFIPLQREFPLHDSDLKSFDNGWRFSVVWTGRTFSRLRTKTAQLTDERIRMTNEIIAGIRIIKMYAWEKPFNKLVEQCRRFGAH